MTCEQQNGDANSQPHLNLYHFQCLLHVSAFVASHHQAVKIYKEKRFKYNPFKWYLLQIAGSSTSQKLEIYKPQLDKSQDCILYFKYNKFILN